MDISELQFGHLTNLSATYGPFGVDIVSNSDMTVYVEQFFNDLIVDIVDYHLLFTSIVSSMSVCSVCVFFFSICVFLPSWRININKQTNKQTINKFHLNYVNLVM